MLEPFEATVMVGNVTHPVSPVRNAVVWVLECHGTEDADGLWWRSVLEKVSDRVGDVCIDLSRMEC